MTSGGNLDHEHQYRPQLQEEDHKPQHVMAKALTLRSPCPGVTQSTEMSIALEAAWSFDTYMAVNRSPEPWHSHGLRWYQEV